MVGVSMLRWPRRRPQIAWTSDLERPQVVAHRGASSLRAEHTLEAYRHALEEGAEGLECDVRLTADGHLVCVHDRRVERTSSGRGVVSAMQLHELEELDWASWKDGDERSEHDDEAPTETLDTSERLPGPEPEPVSEPESEPELDLERGRILTLERLFETVVDWGSPVDLAIETKHPTRYAGLVETRLIELCDRFGWARPKRGRLSPVRVMSFSWFSLRRCLELAPRLEMVYLMDRVPIRFRDGSLPLGSRVAGPSIEVVRAHPRYVARAHAQGNQVHVWTVNTPEDIALCADLGVDAIITDNPGQALAQLEAES
jgi:glycerophosphoryl diester phosphodiesterase